MAILQPYLNGMKTNLADLKNVFIDSRQLLTTRSSLLLRNEYLTVRNGLKTAALLVASFVGYKTVKIFYLRRKYSHIPGPSTNG